jgi:hypothetical protein
VSGEWPLAHAPFEGTASGGSIEAQCSVCGPRYLEEVGDDFLRVGLEGAVDKQKLKDVAKSWC